MDTNPNHHAVPGSSVSEIRTTNASPTPQFGPTVMEISNQGTILASTLGLPLLFEEEASENINTSNNTSNSDNPTILTPSARVILKQVAILEETSGHMMQQKYQHPPTAFQERSITAATHGNTTASITTEMDLSHQTELLPLGGVLSI